MSAVLRCSRITYQQFPVSLSVGNTNGLERRVQTVAGWNREYRSGQRSGSYLSSHPPTVHETSFCGFRKFHLVNPLFSHFCFARTQTKRVGRFSFQVGPPHNAFVRFTAVRSSKFAVKSGWLSPVPVLMLRKLKYPRYRPAWT